MDPDIKIMFCAGQGELVAESKTLVKVSKEYNRKSLPEDEASIDAIWKSRLKENPRLFNGTKFRLHSVTFDVERNLVLNLGLTDYREYIGTNWAPNAEQLRSRGQTDFCDLQAYMSDPLGVGSFVLTTDDHAIFLRRSLHCGEAPGMWDVPGGHAEPEELVGRIPVADVNYTQMTSQAVAHEIFDSILREIRDEVNISQTHLSQPLLMGIAQNTTSACRPSLEFLVQCSLTKEEVLALYRHGDHAEADESTNILLLPLLEVVAMETKDPTLWTQVAPSAKGCVVLYKLCHGLQ